MARCGSPGGQVASNQVVHLPDRCCELRTGHAGKMTNIRSLAWSLDHTGPGEFLEGGVVQQVVSAKLTLKKNEAKEPFIGNYLRTMKGVQIEKQNKLNPAVV